MALILVRLGVLWSNYCHKLPFAYRWRGAEKYILRIGKTDPGRKPVINQRLVRKELFITHG